MRRGRAPGRIGPAVTALAALAAVMALALAGACRAKRAARRDDPVPPPRGDAGPRDDAGGLDAPGPWQPLAAFPAVDPIRVIALPARPDVPRFDVGGPVIAGDVAVVSSSQLGFAAVDTHEIRRGVRELGAALEPLATRPAGRASSTR